MKFFYHALFAAAAGPYHHILASALVLRSDDMHPSDQMGQSHVGPCELSYSSMDCMLITSFAREPQICESRPQATECVLNYFSVYCGDLVDSRKAANKPIPDALVEDAISMCARSVYLGPCVANPDGAACKSNLWAVIKYPTPPQRSGVSKRDEIKCDPAHQYCDEASRAVKVLRRFLPDEIAENQAVQEVMLKMFSWMLKSTASLYKRFYAAAQHEVASRCIGVAMTLGNELLRKYCGSIYKDAIPPPDQAKAAFDKQLETKGSVTALVLYNLVPMTDPVVAAKYMTIEEWLSLAAVFDAPEAAQVSVGGDVVKGFTISAKGTGGTSGVTMFKLGPKGDVFPYENEEETQVALDDALQSGFGDCIEATVQRKVRKRLPSLPACVGKLLPACLKRSLGLQMACPTVSSGDGWRYRLPPIPQSQPSDPSNDPPESSNSEDGIPTWDVPDRPKFELPAPPPLPKDLTLSKFASTNPTLAVTLHKHWFDHINHGVEVEPTVNERGQYYTDVLTSALNIDNPWKREDAVDAISKEFQVEFGLTDDEVMHMRSWYGSYMIDREGLKSGMAKIPDYTGVCIRRTKLNADDLAMLTGEMRGLSGTRGVFEVSDLTCNRHSINWENLDEDARFLMACKPGITTWGGETLPGFIEWSTHVFVIRSRFGKRITAVTRYLDEVDFIDGVSGKFKLLGWAGGTPESPEVFYFDNIL